MAEQRLTFFQKRPTEGPVCGAKRDKFRKF